MKIPETPPSVQELWKRATAVSEVLPNLFDLVPEPLVAGKYLHWDKLKYHAPPEGLDVQTWWLGLRLRRHALQKDIPLVDKAGQV